MDAHFSKNVVNKDPWLSQTDNISMRNVKSQDEEEEEEKDKDKENEEEEQEEKKTIMQEGSLMKFLQEYEEFQKKNMTYGKKNPYQKKTNKIRTVKQQFVRLLSNYDFENMQTAKASKKEKDQFLTSRAAMWNEAEKQDDQEYPNSSNSPFSNKKIKKKKILHTIINLMNLFINFNLTDKKKKKTYFATVMILLSILITCIPSFRNKILHPQNSTTTTSTSTSTETETETATAESITTLFDQGNSTMGTNREIQEQLKQLLQYIQLEKETNKKKSVLSEFLQHWKSGMEKTKSILSEKVMGDKNKTNIMENTYDDIYYIENLSNDKGRGEGEGEGTSIKSAEFKIVKKINEDLKKKISNLEKKLVENTTEINNFKKNSLKEIEQLKQKMKDELYDLQNKYDIYVKKEANTYKTGEGSDKNKEYIMDTLESKMNKNEIKIKQNVESSMESTKKELLQIITDMQHKIEQVEKEFLQKYNKGRSKIYHKEKEKAKNERDGKNEKDMNYETEEEEEEEEEEREEEREEGEQEGGEGREGGEGKKKKRFSFWEKKEVSLKQIQKELNAVKNDTQKYIYFINKTFPSFEEKMQKHVESKVKYFLDTYKKEMVKEFAKTKLQSEENYKLIKQKQETLQTELKKNLLELIHTQIKHAKEEFNKLIINTLENKHVSYNTKELTDWSQANLSAVEILQKKVEELYNEFILDYDQIDWALESLGARIVYKMTSSPLNKNDWIEKFMNHVISFLPSEEIYGLVKPIGKDPSVILKPQNFPGECFSFKGQKGKITIHLPATIDVSSISIQHVHEHINNNPNATPKYFSVYGIIDTNWPQFFETEDINFNDIKNISLYSCLHPTYGNLPAKDILERWINSGKQPTVVSLGDFYFDRKKRIENFVTKHCMPLKRVIFEFTENYGANYTCVYRLKVHGRKCIRKQR